MFFFCLLFSSSFAVSHLMISILPVAFFPSFLKMYFKRPRFGVLIKTFWQCFFPSFSWLLLPILFETFTYRIYRFSGIWNMIRMRYYFLLHSFQLKGFFTLYLERFLEICAIHKLWNISRKRGKRFSNYHQNKTICGFDWFLRMAVDDRITWSILNVTWGASDRNVFWNIPAQLCDVI